jgi:hypothetical protein
LRKKRRLRVFENSVLSRIFGPKRDEVTGEQRRLHSSPNIIRAIKPRRMRQAQHVARMGDRRAYRVWRGNPTERNHLENPRVDGRIILKWILKKWDRGMDWTNLAQDRGRRRVLVNAVMNLRVP